MPALAELEQAWLAGARRPGLPRRARRAAARLRRAAHAAVPRRGASPSASGARVYLKREDLNHTGSHKLNNALGQALLARRMGKRRIIAETGAGQHGVATATVCALLGWSASSTWASRTPAASGPTCSAWSCSARACEPVDAGARTLKEATSAAIRDWVTNVAEHPLRDRLGRRARRPTRRWCATCSG